MSQYKNEKTGKWYAIFRYRTYEGVNKQVKKSGFATKREAKEYEAEFVNKMSGSKDMTFRSLAELYLADCKPRHKATTYSSESYRINKYILPYFGDVPIKDITAGMIRTWQNEQLIPNFQKGTSIDICRNLNSILSYGVKYYGLSSNPAKIAGSVRYPNAIKETVIKYWTQEQFEDFMKHVKDDTYHLAYDILFWCGLRVGELCGLRICDIDFEKGVMQIVQNRVYVVGGTVTHSPKTATSRRTIGIPKRIQREMKRYIGKLYEPKSGDRLIQLQPTTVSWKFREMQKKYQVEPRIRLHDLRHSHASLLLHMGIPAKAIADRLGHANEIMLYRTYGHLYLEQREELVDKLNKL